MKPLTHILIVIFLFSYLWPLTDISHRLIGRQGDVYSHAAHTEWFCDNFFTYNFNTTRFYYPYGVNMSRGYIMPLLITLVCPLRSLGGIALLNVIGAIQMLLIFFISFLFAAKYFRDQYIKIAFVFLYGFSPFVLMRLGEHINLLSTVWSLPLTFLIFHRLNWHSFKQIVRAFSLLGLVFVSAWQNIPNLFPLLSIIFLTNFFRSKSKFQFTSKLCIGLIIAVAVSLPWSLPMIASNNPFSPSSARTYPYTFTKTFSYFMPWENHLTYQLFPASWKLANSERETMVGVDPVIWIMLGIAAFISVRRKALLIPGILIPLCLIYLILPLGQHITINHTTYNIGFFSHVLSTPPFSLTRFPSRIAIGATFFLIFIALYWLDSYLSRHNYPKLPKFIAAYAILSTTIFAHNTQANTIRYSHALPQLGLQQIASSQETSALLHIPVFQDQTKNFLQMFHRKPLISGYVSYAIEGGKTKKLIHESPILNFLDCGIETYSFNPHTISQSSSSFPHLFVQHLKTLNINYLIINHHYLNSHDHCDNLRQLPPTLQSSGLIKTIDTSNTYTVYHILPPPQTSPSIFLSYEHQHFIPTSNNNLVINEPRSQIYILTNYESLQTLSYTITPDVSSLPISHTVKTPDLEQHFALTQPTSIAIQLQLKHGLNTVWLFTSINNSANNSYISHLSIKETQQ